jgi:cell division protein FtsL
MQEEEDDETISVLLTDMFMSNISGFNRLILLLLLAKTLFSWLCNADSVLFMTYMARVLIVIQVVAKKSMQR